MPNFRTGGDESVGTHAICFAYYSVPAARIGDLQLALASAKKAAGVSTAAELHGRELFHDAARMKGDFAELTPAQVEALYDATLAATTGLGKAAIGFVMTRDVKLSLDRGPVSDRTSKIVAPASTLEVHQRSYLPLCAMAGRLALSRQHALDDTIIWHDRDITKAPWLDGRMRQGGQTTPRGFLEGLPSPTFGEPTALPAQELMEMADTVAYFAQRAANHEAAGAEWFFDRLYSMQPSRAMISYSETGQLVVRMLD
jgi:hypothetical protein